MSAENFPLVCEECLGADAFVKMLRGGANQGTCRMCQAPYTVFSWKSGRSGFNKTEVCHCCSQTKNLCQTCLRDLKFGLPSQLRDAVLHSATRAQGGLSTLDPAATATQQRYFQQQQMALVEAGCIDQTAGHAASDR